MSEVVSGLREVTLLDFELPLKPLYDELKTASLKDKPTIEAKINKGIEELYKNLTNWQITLISRHPYRPHTTDYINTIFEDVTYLSGDRLGHDDKCIVGALAKFQGQSVVVVGHQKGGTVEESIECNFGMPKPEGYRKAQRLFRLAEQFNKPIITFIDTPGAFPGLEGEERSQSEAIAKTLREMGDLKVPIICVIIGEGGSGGALGLAIGNQVMMLEYSIYSVISPEACAAILWKDANKKEVAAKMLKNDAQSAKNLEVIDEIIKEGYGGAHRNWDLAMDNMKKAIASSLKKYKGLSGDQILEHRMNKFFEMGKKV